MRLVLLILLGLAFITGCKNSDSTTTAAKPKAVIEQVGIPLYPGSMKVEENLSKTAPNGSKTAYAEYSTTDTYDKVVKFYQEQLNFQAGQMPGAKLTQLIGKTSTGDFVQIMVGPNAPNTKIQYFFVLPKSALQQ